MIFATFPEAEYQAVVLTHDNVKDRLLSYSFTKKLRKGELKEYVEIGYINRGVKNGKADRSVRLRRGST